MDNLLTYIPGLEALHQCGWVHRDISMGNILIDIETEKGFLNDWDHCKYKGEMNQVASQPSRSVGDGYVYPRKDEAD